MRTNLSLMYLMLEILFVLKDSVSEFTSQGVNFFKKSSWARIIIVIASLTKQSRDRHGHYSSLAMTL